VTSKIEKALRAIEEKINTFSGVNNGTTDLVEESV